MSLVGGNTTAALRVLERIRPVQSASDEGEVLQSLLDCPHPRVVAFVNAHSINMAMTDTRFASNIAAADVVLRDGVGAAIVCRTLGLDPGRRNANGTDLIPRLLRMAAGRRIAVYGTSEPWLSKATASLSRLYGAAVVGCAHGFHPDPHYASLVDEHQPDIVILGMGMPKQERVAVMLRESFDRPLLIVNGGAVLDFAAQRFRRAPRWLRALRLEWAYRLMAEPRRLFSRYVSGAPRLAMSIVGLRSAL